MTVNEKAELTGMLTALVEEVVGMTGLPTGPVRNVLGVESVWKQVMLVQNFIEKLEINQYRAGERAGKRYKGAF